MSDKDVTEVLQADAEGIARAARILAAGGLVAVPTETVYGLAARADSAEAVAKIYAAKGRPDFNPLIVHVRDLAQAEKIGEFDARARDLVERFWPGPLTLVLPLREDAKVAGAVTAGLPTIALRQPAHKVMRAVLEETGSPLAAPSANRSEEISPTRPEHVIASLGKACPVVLDGGASQKGLESTIVALRPDAAWSLLRPGPVSHETLERILGAETGADNASIEAPGQLARHYSPGKPLRLSAAEVAPDEFFIGFGGQQGDCNLSAGGDLNEAAAQLYECLHQAAASDKPRIAVAPIPYGEVGRAINDRLRRAATRQN
ncbi:L-threonylcarbamoyladenylate synthase [Erythrobacter sp. THAF29]|uniref:L-threonylcarbamoyladenylate synthase n=1 Tax=Erythrobacter sp. THAF29 TaxID=2587851 RepID=UPI001269297F|nr:L-threonylcarbamoyladenylate synthase [Erythrobacter sp. THAF29]QFT76356.1 Threonylcarbamoyl-AMP synthase [Erythrobacter sp. THAF29]